MGKTNTHISNHTYHASQVSLVSAHATCKPCPSHIPSPWRGEIIGAMIHINNPTQQHQHQRKPTAIPPYRHLVNQHSQPKVSSTKISQQTKYLFSINHKILFSSIHTNRTTNDFTPTFPLKKKRLLLQSYKSIFSHNITTPEINTPTSTKQPV